MSVWTDVTVAREIAEDFQSFEAHEMPLWDYERDVELVRWALRCLANPDNGFSADALDGITKQRVAKGSSQATPDLIEGPPSGGPYATS